MKQASGLIRKFRVSHGIHVQWLKLGRGKLLIVEYVLLMDKGRMKRLG
jgi:hypothetical protein